MATTTGRYLTEEQVAGYHADGYLILPRVIEMAEVQALRRVTDAFVETAGAAIVQETAAIAQTPPPSEELRNVSAA